MMVLAAFCAYFVKGMCGFANTMVFGTVMSFKTDNINITPVELLVNYPSNIIIAYKERKKLNIRALIILSACIVVGNIPGVFFLKIGDAGLIKFLFGIVIAAIGVQLLLSGNKANEKKPKLPVIMLIGMISGLICGVFGIGALMVVCVRSMTEDTGALRGTHNAIFAVEGLFRIIVYSITGIITLQTVQQALYLIPVMLISLYLGTLVSKKVSEKTARMIINIMLIFSGFSICVTNFATVLALVG